MTVGRLLEEASSLELSMWGIYLVAAEEKAEQRREQAKQEREITGG